MVYVPIGSSTAEHDFYAMTLVQRSKMHEPTMLPGETAEAFALRLTSELISSQDLWALLGCIVAPKDAAGALWTRESGAATAKHLASLTDEGDKAMIRSLVVELVLHFLAHGVLSLMTSASSGETRPPSSSTTPASAMASGVA